MFEKQKITQEYTCTVQHQFVLHTTLCAGTLCAGITHNTMVIFHDRGGGAGRRRGRASRVNIKLFFYYNVFIYFLETWKYDFF